jgi:hypothetical protein
MKNLKFLTCKRHNALTWKNPWINIKLCDLNFLTQVGLKGKQDKTKKTIKKEKKIKLECKESSKWMTMLYKSNPFIHGQMKYVVIVGMSTNFQLCKLTLLQVVFNYNSKFEFFANTLPPLLYIISFIHPYYLAH